MKTLILLLALTIPAPLFAQTDRFAEQEHQRQLDEMRRRQDEIERENARLRELERRREQERSYYNNPLRPMRPQGRDCGPFRSIC